MCLRVFRSYEDASMAKITDIQKVKHTDNYLGSMSLTCLGGVYNKT